MDAISLVVWVVTGLAVSYVAKLLLPEPQAARFVSLGVLGVLGSLMGGLLGTILGFGGIDWGSVMFAALGTLPTLGLFVTFSRTIDAAASRVEIEGERELSLKFANAKVLAPENSAVPSAREVSSLVQPQEPIPAPSEVSPQNPSRSKSCTVFISYRRTDSPDIAGRIYDRLSGRFGTESVFKDVDSIPLGVDFRRHIQEMVSACSVLLVIIGKDWLGSAQSNGPRLQNPSDYVRIEVEAALGRDIPVIPVLVQGAAIPLEEDLPPSVKELVYRNGISVRHDPDFHRDMDRLLAALEGSRLP